MRIAVIGAGGVGGGFGAALAKAGADVSFLARGAHLAAMKSQGLKVLGPRGDIHLTPTRATDDPAEIGKVDVVLFCVKLWDVESAGERIIPLIGENTAVVPLQNGIDAPERLIPILGKSAVMGGVAQISASITAPGTITQVGTFMRMVFGEFDGSKKPARRGFSGAVPEGRVRGHFKRSDPHRPLDEVHPAREQRRHDVAGAPADRRTSRRSRHAADFSCRLSGSHRRRPRPRRCATRRRAAADLDLTKHFPPAMKASMALDLDRGNRLEVPWLSGKVLEFGRQFGIPTPTHGIMYAMLKPYVMGRAS